MERLSDVEEMTLSEFHYKTHAQEYKEIDDMYRLHLAAFLNRNASATENKGTDKNPKEEYIFKKFEDFFDYEKAIKQVEGQYQEPEKATDRRQLSPAELAMKRNK
ncbi:hypothetical protein [Alkalibacillus salilacus]|nr:hypothetical protein [Alkalibacillus salilacus]